MLKKLKPYIISIAISLGIGTLSAFFTRGNMEIYSSINNPPLSPPSILFPIVWSILYILMGISAAIIYKSAADPMKKKKALTSYAISLGFNFIWSIIFFNLRLYLVAFVILLFLLLYIVKTIISYYEINKLASLLQIPYLLWVTFAGYLNLGIFILN